MKEQAQRRIARVRRDRPQERKAHSPGSPKARAIPDDRIVASMTELQEPVNVWLARDLAADRRQRSSQDDGRPLILVVFGPDLDRAAPGV
jgi:hypothetical protein